MAHNQTHGQFKAVNYRKWSQNHLFAITGYTELPIGSEVLIAPGYGDNSDSIAVYAKYLGKPQEGSNGLCMDQRYWNHWHDSHSDIAFAANCTEEQWYDLMNDVYYMYIAGGEL